MSRTMASHGTTQQEARQPHRHGQSMDSEISYFEPSSTSTHDSWSGYFDNWHDPPALDKFCPAIASCEGSPSNVAERHSFEPELLPAACQKPVRPVSTRRAANVKDTTHHTPQRASQRSSHPQAKAKRYGIVSLSSPSAGDAAATELDTVLQSTNSDTEAILAAMYNPSWDISSLQKWYKSTQQTPADLALLKIMFSLKYTPDDCSPLG